MALSYAKNSRVRPGIRKIKHIIAVASGKGGVGKSTVATNIAIALKERGAEVGLLDADIYGPSQPGMLGSRKDQPNIGENVLHPMIRHGVSFVSMGLLTDDDSPVIWRAPIAMKMIQQFLESVMWGELDYLVVDLPPGTGDVQLTISQQAQLSGVIIVTTPQEIALGVARKGLRMFEQVKVPVIGVIENMSGFTCTHCGQETAIFDKGGGEKMAAAMKVPFLGALPLDPEIMMSGENGTPVLTKSKDSPAARAILSISDSMVKSLGRVAEQLGERPKKLEVASDGRLYVRWPDESENKFDAHFLRVNCPCALCVDEDTGKRTLDPAQVPLDITIRGVNRVGNYGFSVDFSDGHSTGIYKYIWLKEQAGTSEQANGKSFSV